MKVMVASYGSNEQYIADLAPGWEYLRKSSKYNLKIISIISYDANGNLVSKSESVLNTDGTYGQAVITESYTYDSFNRMIRYESGDIYYSYTYDAEGVRRSKQNNNVQGSKITYISDTLCEYSQTLAELNSSDELCTSYTIGLELISLTRGEEEYYYISDGHGDVRIITDEDGHVKIKYRYSGYGEMIENSGDIENSHMYAGECYDEESGLYYLRARYMNPSTGTFTGMDSYAGNISDPDTLHKYLYANGNPIKYVDPSGNFYTIEEQLTAMGISNEFELMATINIVGMIGGLISEVTYGLFGTEENKMLDSFLDGYCHATFSLSVTLLVSFIGVFSIFTLFMVEEIAFGTKEVYEASYCWNTGRKGAAIYHFIWGLLHYIFAVQLHKADTKFRNSTEEARAAKEAEKAAEKATETASEAVQEGGRNSGIDKLDWSTVNKKGQTALEHIQKHASPNYQREMHGVFRGNAKTIIEEAWKNRGNAKIVSDNMGGTIYNIYYQNAGYNTGYINFGQQMNYVTIIVQDGTSKVWTAFPSFGDYGMKVSY